MHTVRSARVLLRSVPKGLHHHTLLCCRKTTRLGHYCMRKPHPIECHHGSSPAQPSPTMAVHLKLTDQSESESELLSGLQTMMRPPSYTPGGRMASDSVSGGTDEGMLNGLRLLAASSFAFAFAAFFSACGTAVRSRSVVYLSATPLDRLQLTRPTLTSCERHVSGLPRERPPSSATAHRSAACHASGSRPATRD